MSQTGEHGALGSNQKLERVATAEDGAGAVAEKKLEVFKNQKPDSPTSSATEEDDGDVVYLRDDLRPGLNG